MKAVFFPRYVNDELARVVNDIPGVSFVIARDAEELARALPGAEFLIIGNRAYDERVARTVRKAGTALRLIQFSTSGVERGLQFGLPQGVAVASAPGVKAQSVAEHAMALVLADFRRIQDAEKAREAQQWRRAEINDYCLNLEESTVVIFGLGAIGREIARKAKAFDARIIAISSSARVGPTIDEVADRAKLREILPSADILVLSAPSVPETFHLIGEAELRAMKKTALLVNISRGDLVDEEALTRALREGWIRAAAVDVAEVEPLPPGHPLWQLPNIMITPHIAGSGPGGYVRFREIFLENVKRIGARQDPLHAVRPQAAGA